MGIVAKKPPVGGQNMTEHNNSAKLSSKTAMAATGAESTTPSSADQQQICVQLLGRDVVVPSTLTDAEYFTILIAAVSGLMRNTYSSDILCLAFADAQETCNRLGISPEKSEHILREVGKVAEQIRQQNPIAQCLF